jgi:vancomycin permeability regulator SanA
MEYGVVFGAYVGADRKLSDITRERIEGAVRSYRQGNIQKIFISGDNRHNQEADAIALYAQDSGVPDGDLIVDRLGIDTHDTCRHFRQVSSEGILFTQGYHLPRAMYMCERSGVSVAGLAVNRMNILTTRGNNVAVIYTTRVTRFLRESTLTWLYILGLYDRISSTAEEIEAGSLPDRSPQPN